MRFPAYCSTAAPLLNLTRLLKRRQIRHSRSCATATAYLLLRVISACRTTDAVKLIERVQSVGRRLVAAQPREMVVGNIVRRVLGLIRDEAEDDREADFNLSEAGSESQPQTPRVPDGRLRCSPLHERFKTDLYSLQTLRMFHLLVSMGRPPELH